MLHASSVVSGPRVLPARALALLKIFPFCRFRLFQWGLMFYLPLIINDDGNGDRSAAQVALLSAVPYTFAAIASILTSWSSDRSRERILHGSVGNFVAAAGLGLTATLLAGANGAGKAPSSGLQLAALTVATVGSASSFPVRKAFEADILERDVALFGLAVMKTISIAGGIVGPALVGALKEANGGSFVLPMAALAVSYALSGLLFMTLRCVAGRTVGSA